MSHDRSDRPDVLFGSSSEGLDTVPVQPKIDQLFETLSNHRRRLILLLVKHGKVETKADLMARGGGETAATDIELIHVHLPKLAEAEYIEWDRDTGDIAKGPRFNEIEPVLDLIENHAHELLPHYP